MPRTPQETHASFTESIPMNYDRFLGPVLFDPFARDLSVRVVAAHPKRIVETACGTGRLTRHLLERMDADARLDASDLNEPMIRFATIAVGPDRRLHWRTADMTALPYEDGSFDAAVCQFGLMFVPDKQSAIREARRVLAPGGRFVFNVWDSLDRLPFASIANDTIREFFPSDPPTFYQTPFSMYDRPPLRRMLEGCGFADVRDDAVAFDGQAPTAESLARGLVEGNPVLLEIQARGTAQPETIRSVLAERLAARLGDRPVRVRLQAFVFEARAA